MVGWWSGFGRPFGMKSSVGAAILWFFGRASHAHSLETRATWRHTRATWRHTCKTPLSKLQCACTQRTTWIHARMQIHHLAGVAQCRTTYACSTCSCDTCTAGCIWQQSTPSQYPRFQYSNFLSCRSGSQSSPILSSSNSCNHGSSSSSSCVVVELLHWHVCLDNGLHVAC